MTKYLLITHKEDNDGIFSSAIVYNYLISNLGINKNEIHTLGFDYNELTQYGEHNTPQELHKKYENIVMTDISFNDPKYMKALYNEFKNHFIWCDHHKPIIDSSFKYKFDNCPGVRDTSKSAILCVYEFLYDSLNEKYNQIDISKPISEFDREFPEFFRILSGWDSWSYEREGYTNEYVRNINKGTTVEFGLNFNKVLSVVNYIIDIYQNGLDIRYENDLISNMYNLGKQLNDYDDTVISDIIKNFGDCSWQVKFDDKDKGRPLYHKACAIFHQGYTNSLMFKSLERKGINHGLVFKHQPNGNWILSMYNINETEWTHCGEFLKERYNGGGHKGAAGCTLTQEQFINILKTKTI